MSVTIKNTYLPRVVTGTWTHTEGTAMETMSVTGHVLSTDFKTNKSSGPDEPFVRTSQSTSGAVTTITIYCNVAVTAGTFRIETTL